ncbi:MAG: hypothetical protein LBS01_11810 [Prevotellaceae bacterium]|jgi:hypothetical protein|nr:hypothetical protein [Prevotellaceae bacterium]
MKKIIIILFLSVLFFQLSFGQKDLSGIYTNEAGMQIIIDGNLFYYRIPNAPEVGFIVFYNDTLAECTIKRIDKNFIEINSEPPWYKVINSLKLCQSIDTTITSDSIKVSFAVPYDRSSLTISLFTDEFKQFDLNYSENNKSLMLPNNTKTITFSVLPEAHLALHSPEGLFYGVLYYSSIKYDIGKHINRVEIEIPAIDNSFFEKYYVKGEYARVRQNKIEWKGETFVKK